MKQTLNIGKSVCYVLASAVIFSFAGRAVADCNRISGDNSSSSEDKSTCVKITTYNEQCEKPTPDDWSMGCTEASGLVRQDTYNGTQHGFKFDISIGRGVCSLEIGYDCTYCTYPSSPTTSTMVSGTVANTYTCGGG